MGRSVFSLTIPRQHGAWSILAAASLLGLATAGRLGFESLLFVAAVLSGFIAQHTAELWLKLSPFDRRRKNLTMFLSGYCLACGLLGMVLLLGYQRRDLVPLGALALALVGFSLLLAKRHQTRSAAGEVTSVLALTLALPAAVYSTTGRFLYPTWGMTLLAALFFCGSVFHVRFLVRNARQSLGPASARLRAGWQSLAYHTIILAVGATLGAASLLPFLAPLALVPASAKAVWAVVRPRRAPAAIKTVGQIELIHTVIFVILAVLLALPQGALSPGLR